MHRIAYRGFVIETAVRDSRAPAASWALYSARFGVKTADGTSVVEDQPIEGQFHTQQYATDEATAAAKRAINELGIVAPPETPRS